MATKKKSKLDPKKEFLLGWLPDIPDARDMAYAAPMKVMMALPPKADLRAKCPPVYNQGHLGSCTANALGGAFQYGQTKQGRATFMPSRLFLYYNERVMMNTVAYDSGAYIRDGIKSLNTTGICKETLWPYDITKFAIKPPPACYTQAKVNEISAYLRLDNNIITLKGCLAEGFPFVFGFTVYDSFYKITSNGIMPMPNFSKEKRIGGHAVMAVGYDDSKQMVLIRNSWGPGWGMAGYFWMPYNYISNNNLATDFWTIRTVK